MKVVTLSQINCPEEVFNNLERIYYEVVSHERILALTLTNDTVSLEGAFKNYYEDYMSLYKEYDIVKMDFYNNYLTKIEDITQYQRWEADFRTRTVILHE